jgi:hypothetical protein
MTKISNVVKQLVDQVDRRKLRNNTQKVLFALLTSSEESVSRSSLRIPSVSARLRDLRKDEFGAFDLQVRTVEELNASAAKEGRATRKVKDPRSTFYRLNPRTITLSRVSKVFEGVISTQK